MKENPSRRDFIKKTSLSAAGLAAISYAPWSKALGSTQDKSTVVVCKDDKCFDWDSNPDNQEIHQDRVQDMVDHTVMTLTGVSEKSKAYEALFPKPVTTSTKILIHYNTMKPKITRVSLCDAVKNGLTSMLDNSFPADNVRIVDREGAANTNEKVKITSSLEYTIKDIWVDCDYYIKCPHCWAIDNPVGGISMNLKGMITAVGGPTWMRLHSYTVSPDTPWMPIMNSHPVFRSKLALCIVNAITYSNKPANTSSADGAAHTLFASKDLVASEYMGLQLLKEKGLMQENQETANTNLGYAANEPYNLGTNDPDNMNIINISPPWNTQIITSGNKSVHTADIEVQSSLTHTQFVHTKASGIDKTIAVYSMSGKKIWAKRSTENRIVWQHNDLTGRKVSSGMYLYRVKLGDIITQGRILVK
jgi:hypothetical protein